MVLSSLNLINKFVIIKLNFDYLIFQELLLFGWAKKMAQQSSNWEADKMYVKFTNFVCHVGIALCK